MHHDQIFALVSEVAPKAVAIRRDFHQHPELGFTEFRTASLIARRCADLGYTVKVGREVMKADARLGLPSEEELEAAYQRAVAEGGDPEFLPLTRGGFTGLVAELKTGRPGPTVGMRFDIDALPVKEADTEDHLPTREGFQSVHPGIMHSCGHDGHAAMGLAVAEVVAKMADQLCGTIRFIFQPSEEECRGAYPMAEAGAADGLDYLLSVHLGLYVPSGELYTMLAGLLASTKMDVTFTGKPAHASAKPHEGHNALMGAAQALQGLYAISRHGQGNSRINVGLMRGGSGRNIIADNAFMALEVRGETDEVLAYMEDRSRKVLEGAALANDLGMKIDVVGRALTGCDSPELATVVAEEASKVPGLVVHNKGLVDRASDDYTVFEARVKEQGGQSIYMALGSNLPDGHHTYRFDFNEADMKNGIAVFALAAARLCVQG